MLKVVFINVEDNLIPNYDRIDFVDAVKSTDTLEKQYRDDKKKSSSEFTVISTQTNNVLYHGTFHFGSYNYKNLYHQIKDNARYIKVDKSKESEKAYLLEGIEKLTPEEYKVTEVIDKEVVNLDKRKISKLKRWQRRSIYLAAVLTLTSLLFLATFSLSQFQHYEQFLKDSELALSEQKTMLSTYESALLGDREVLKTELAEKELNDNQMRILVEVYLTADEFDKAVDLMGNPVEVENLIANMEWANEKQLLEKLTKFNEMYPTNEGRFDIAYFTKDYELMLNLPEVSMTAKRSRMKTYALVKLGKIDEAKVELQNNNDERLTEIITKYEVLTAEISTINEQVKKEKASENEKEIKRLTTLLKEKEKELGEL